MLGAWGASVCRTTPLPQPDLRYLLDSGRHLVDTSGLGVDYPSDLVIGKVEELRLDAAGAAEQAVIAPAADVQHLTDVFIIKSFDIVS